MEPKKPLEEVRLWLMSMTGYFDPIDPYQDFDAAAYRLRLWFWRKISPWAD